MRKRHCKRREFKTWRGNAILSTKLPCPSWPYSESPHVKMWPESSRIALNVPPHAILLTLWCRTTICGVLKDLNILGAGRPSWPHSPLPHEYTSATSVTCAAPQAPSPGFGFDTSAASTGSLSRALRMLRPSPFEIIKHGIWRDSTIGSYSSAVMHTAVQRVSNRHNSECPHLAHGRC